MRVALGAEVLPQSGTQRAVFVLLLSTLTGVTAAQESPEVPTPAAEARPGAPERVVDSTAWQNHFDAWVEKRMVAPEIRAATLERAEPRDGETLRVLEALEADYLRTLREPAALPDQVLPRPLARGLTGPALAAARAFATGDTERALTVLRHPSLAGDASAAHLRAQLLDRLTREAGAHPIYRLATIDLYRTANRLDEETLSADRAKLRIGQIYLELGFFAEARAQLASAAESIGEPYATQARITLAESLYLHHEFEGAFAQIEAIDPARLSVDGARWALRRSADSLLFLDRTDEALERYETLIADVSWLPPPLVHVRHAFALIETLRPADARAALALSAAAGPRPEVAALAGVLLARALRTEGSFEAAEKIATETVALDSEPALTALAALESIESARARGADELTLPESAQALAAGFPDHPALGLLAFVAADGARADEQPILAEQRLGTLIAMLSRGPVRELARAELARRVGDRIAVALEDGSHVDDATILLLEGYLDPTQLDESTLLLGLAELAHAESRSACMRWARVLERREKRSVRRGLAAWRRVGCMNLVASDRNSSNRILVLADSGEAGPFALALAARAAEQQLRAGDLDRAVRTYSRALEALREPLLVAPIVLRLGELQIEAGKPRTALRHLRLGFALTSSDRLVADPFRKSAVIALARAALRGVGRELLAATLREDRERVEPFWTRAYDYLAFRIAAKPSVEGDDFFARGASELESVEELARQVERLEALRKPRRGRS